MRPESKKPANAGFLQNLGVADGTRTHDDQNHNLGLYQLSYSHRRSNSEPLLGEKQNYTNILLT